MGQKRKWSSSVPSNNSEAGTSTMGSSTCSLFGHMNLLESSGTSDLSSGFIIEVERSSPNSTPPEAQISMVFEGGREREVRRREENGRREMERGAGGSWVDLDESMPDLEEIETEVEVVDLTGEYEDSGNSEEEGMGQERGGRERRMVLRPDWIKRLVGADVEMGEVGL